MIKRHKAKQTKKALQGQPTGFTRASLQAQSKKRQRALEAVIRVGKGGRGFVVEDKRGQRFVITAAHCLPSRPDDQRLPPPHGASYLEERTYEELLARLGEQPSVSCECKFVDPIADIAVLGTPDNPALSEAYEKLFDTATPLLIAEPPSEVMASEVARLAELRKSVRAERLAQRAKRECRAFLLSLNQRWFPCKVQHLLNGPLSIVEPAKDIARGMSGSPIISEDGKAIGVVCLGERWPQQ